jgi:hypothetical protein
MRPAFFNISIPISVFNLYFMKSVERDLLILLHEDKYDQAGIELEVKQITDLLTSIETPEFLVSAVELVDCNSHRITSKPKWVTRAISRKALRAFEFIVHKN